MSSYSLNIDLATDTHNNIIIRTLCIIIIHSSSATFFGVLDMLIRTVISQAPVMRLVI